MTEENLWALVSRTIQHSGSIEKAVFVLLAAFSVVSWTLVFWKICALYEARKNGRKFLTAFNGADNFGTALAAEVYAGASPLLSVFKAAVQALESARPAPGNPGVPGPAGSAVEARRIAVKPPAAPDDMVLMGMQHTAQAEIAKLQTGLSFLATVGSTSPFIGLFGTVWGIMNTFRELGNAKSASIAVVAPGISSALIATAAGLAVAIPAVMAYNWFLGQTDDLQDEADRFIERLSILIKASGWQGLAATRTAPPTTPSEQPAAGSQPPAANAAQPAAGAQPGRAQA
ncbi:MAG: MotA/TolQ/ExbB proton channel family protein [Planctomycetota bacterium]|nr:MotA/TolQ/ExbB proton channel family protein [Planctomycetota bacterium]